jgi:hypothetical protein
MTELEMKAVNATETYKFILTRAGYMLSVYLMVFLSSYSVSVVPYAAMSIIYILMVILCSFAFIFLKPFIKSAVVNEPEKFIRHKLEKLWFLKPLSDVALSVAIMFIFSFNAIYWMHTFAQFVIFATVIQTFNTIAIYRIIKAA